MINVLSSFGVEVKVLANQSSIFDAYKKGVALCDASDQDIIILCHDDIELRDTKVEFFAKLAACVHSDVGIVGPAGTTSLGVDAVWWNQERWAQGLHSGIVHHVHQQEEGYSPPKITPTEYGPYKQVVALDGLFLAARKEVWEAVSLEKPTYFEGDWDFYDIHYTTTAHNLGYRNQTIPLKIIHHSGGDLVGRDSWHKNREAFIKNTKELPLSC